MLLVDAHCHINLVEKPKELIKVAVANGVAAMICSGDSSKDCEECIELADAKHVFATIGIGPDFACKEESYVDTLEEMIRKYKGKIVGIGEIGLDAKVDCELKIQEEVFKAQIDIAKRLNMPIVVHSRQMMERVMNILQQSNVEKAMMHFFEGTEEQAAKLAEAGYLLSFPPLSSGRRNRIIKMLPLNNIVTETDSPFVGKDPTEVAKTLELISKIKGVSVEDVAYAIAQNIRNLFNINIDQGP